MPNWTDDNGVSWFGHEGPVGKPCDSSKCEACGQSKGLPPKKAALAVIGGLAMTTTWVEVDEREDV